MATFLCATLVEVVMKYYSASMPMIRTTRPKALHILVARARRTYLRIRRAHIGRDGVQMKW